MAKIELKKELGEAHGFECYICGGEITQQQIEKGLIDTDRLIPKREGGSYEIDITRLACPLCHRKREGNHRIRPEDLGELKVFMDAREQWLKLRNKIDNQLRAIERKTDDYTAESKAELEAMTVIPTEKEEAYNKAIYKWVQDHKEEGIIKSALNVMGLGELTIAGLLNYVVVEKAKHRSSVWSYLGLHKPSHDRYTKGKTSGGNKTLRTILWRTADSMWRNRNCVYRLAGEKYKERLADSEKLVRSRNTKGFLTTISWAETKPCHRHGAALRKIMKEVSGDYWVVARKFLKLETDGTYSHDMLGHDHQVDPRERGWLYPRD